MRRRVPWVPEPRNLSERKLVRGKERKKKGGCQLSLLPYCFFLLFFGSGSRGRKRDKEASNVSV